MGGAPMSERLDPLTQDIYFKPLMGNAWHLWKARSQVSVCGLGWEVAAMCFDATNEKPAKDICEQCNESA